MTATAKFRFRIARYECFTVLLVLALIGALLPAGASAGLGPIGLSASGGVSSDGEEDFFLGAGARFSLGTLAILPNAEYIFVENGTSYSLNGDVALTVLPLAVASGWVGAGVGLFTVDPDASGPSTETVVNLLAGVGITSVPLKPYGQLKYVFREGDDPFVFSVGVRF